jgi:sugar/nucleoside kinase (ribokinase family)
MDGLERASGPSFHWVGRYDFDLNTAHTLDTRLGVFADFKPVLPEAYRDAEWLFLANIDPELQLEVLEQVASPRLVACDTMNYWIQGKKDALLRLFERIDIVLLNDAEIRQLTGKANLLRAARDVMERGPRAVVVKKGEHGAMLFTAEGVFFVPGYPLETVFDPTGAGDSFAGGFLGHLAAGGTVDVHHLRRAMVYGSAMGSFAVERFSAGRLKDLTLGEVHARVREFRSMTHFELAEPLPESAGSGARA